MPIPRKPIRAVILNEIAFHIARKIPGLLGVFGDDASAVLRINTTRRAALGEIIQAIIHIQIRRRRDAQRFEQSPGRANARPHARAAAEHKLA